MNDPKEAEAEAESIRDYLITQRWIKPANLKFLLFKNIISRKLF
jgi:hypothetical protein